MNYNFKLKGNDNKLHTLDEFKGSKVIVYFYPKDNTPGCTLQATEFTKYKKDFAKLGYKIVGISNDSYESHCKFTTKHNLEILLLSDEDYKVAKQYGIYSKTNPLIKIKRSTFIFDEKGNLVKEYISVKSKGNADMLLEELKTI